MTFIDLKSAWRKWKDPPAIKEERSHEFRKNHFLPVDGFSSPLRISTVRATLQRQLQSQKLLLLGPVSLDGLRSVNRPGKSSSHRGLPARYPLTALPCGHSRQCFAKHLGACESGPQWRIYADFAQILITKARLLYANDPFGVELEQSVYALDSTTIDLCLAVFARAQFRQRKAAVKLLTLLDLRGCIPSVVIVTTGKLHNVRVLDQLPIEPGAIYIVDRGYIDFTRLHGIHLTGGFFVTRAKNNFRFQRLHSQPTTAVDPVVWTA